MQDAKDTHLSGAGFFIRLDWLFLGNALLFCLLVFIIEKRLPLPSFWDSVYLAPLISLIVSRYGDIRFLNGQTGEGKPATMAHWRRYAILISLVGVGAWLLTLVFVHFLK